MTRTAILFLVAAASGCASLTNPVADGVPVNRLPAEVKGRPKADLRPVPLTLLRQKAPTEYVLNAGDVLAVSANEIFAPGDQLPPVRLDDQGGRAPVVGYPVPVRDDGTISIPLLPPLTVRGRTVKEVERLLLDTITGKNGGPELVKAGAARVSVQLLQKRQHQILVVRQDSPGGVSNQGVGLGVGLTGLGSPVGGAGVFGGGEGKRGLGFTLNLPAYENDVLRASTPRAGCRVRTRRTRW